MKAALRIVLLVIAALLALPARAHVGSKDVFETINAGPYKLFVTIRVPNVIPGVATVEVRTSSDSKATVESIRITPMPLTGEASKHPPTADTTQRSKDDPSFFTGSLWLMASGSWQVRLEMDGSAGPATASIPVAAAPLTVLTMQRPLGLLLGALGLVLALGFAGIVGAAVRESRLPPGETPKPSRMRRARASVVAAAILIGFAIYLSNMWWNSEAADYASDIYHPLKMDTTLNGNQLKLVIEQKPDRDPGKKSHRREVALDDLLLDHGKVMHLYAIRWPEMDAAFHLHPSESAPRELSATLPAMPAGKYRLYADIVHANGFPETLLGELNVAPGMSTAPVAADDASATPAPVSAGELGASYKLPDGYTMVWDKPASLTAGTAALFHFRLLDPSGKPAAGMQPYLGMAGHAAFVKTDGTVFAHTHPDGSAAMPAMLLANGESLGVVHASETTAAMENMPGMETSGKMDPQVDFPYGFPSAGRYRIFIQMKHGGVVETGVFDAEVH